MPIKFPPPPFLVGQQFQSLNRWLLDIQSLLNSSGQIDASSVSGLVALESQVASNTANITTLNTAVTMLDNEVAILSAQYSSGAWMPTLQGSTTGGTPTYAIQAGTWEKIGRMVTARFSVSTSALGAPAGNMQLSGLPFVSTSTANDNGGCVFYFMSGVTLDTGYATLTGIVPPNTSLVSLQEIGTGIAGQTILVSKFAAATFLEGAVFYHTP